MLNINDNMWREATAPMTGAPAWTNDIAIPRRGPFPAGTANGSSAGTNGSSSSNGGNGIVAANAAGRGVVSPHSEEMNMMLAENLDSILGPSPGAKIEKAMGRLSLNAASASSEEAKDKCNSPYDTNEDNGNSGTNGIEPPENGFRTVGSRQGSPSNGENDINKNTTNNMSVVTTASSGGVVGVGGGGGGMHKDEIVGNGVTAMAHLQHHLQQHHHHQQLLEHAFHGQIMLDPLQFGGLHPPDPHSHHPFANIPGLGHQQPGGPSPPAPSPGGLQQHPGGDGFAEQQVYRNQSNASQAAQQQQQQQQSLALLQQQQQQLFAQQQQQQQLAAAAGFPGTTGPYVLSPQEQQYLAAAAAGVLPGQNPALSVLSFPYAFGGVPWGMYPASMAAAAAAGLTQLNGQGVPPGVAANGPNGGASTPGAGNGAGVGATTNGNRRPGSPSNVNGGGPPTPGPTDLSNAATGPGGATFPVYPGAFIDPSNGAFLRMSGSVPSVRLMQPGPLLLHNQTLQAAAAAAGANPNGFNSLNLHQQNSLGYGGGGASSNLSSLGSPSIGSLSGFSGGRRDSLDRNSQTAFSPSLIDQFNKNNKPGWPNYGPMASTGLGIGSGSLTPPPAGLGGGGLSLFGGPRFSTAPGSDRFAPNAAMVAAAAAAASRNGMLGPAGINLFGTQTAGVVGLGGKARHNSIDKAAVNRSRLLEDFRNNRYPNLQLRDIANHVVEFSMDQHGSRFIQQKLERASPQEKQLIFAEILTSAHSLMTDVFGNYVIQKFFDHGSPDQKTALVQKLRTNVQPLALQMYGCRVIQKALETIPLEQQKWIIAELEESVLKCVKDQNGNHVVQKCIECVDPSCLQFIIDAFKGQVFSLSTHPYGCRVIQRILEHCTLEQTTQILDELHASVEQLLQDQYGNYVIQHVLEHGKPEDKSKIVAAVRGKVLSLSQHKFASNVVEKCVQYATRPERTVLIDEVCALVADGTSQCPLHLMMKDQYANYVVQKMIDLAEPSQRKILMHKIRPHCTTLRKYTYGKHIQAKLDKYFLKNNTELGPIGPPGSSM